MRETMQQQLSEIGNLKGLVEQLREQQTGLEGLVPLLQQVADRQEVSLEGFLRDVRASTARQDRIRQKVGRDLREAHRLTETQWTATMQNFYQQLVSQDRMEDRRS